MAGLDPSSYTDAAWFDAERATLFADEWIPVGRASEVAEAGSYLTADIAGEPVVVTRAGDGELAALANVCRHRNSRIVSGSGTVAALQCPYHLWTYRLDGTLTGAPGMNEVVGFDVADHCLPRLGVDTWQGFLFVNQDLDAPPVAAGLEELDALIDEYELGSMVPQGEHRWDCPFNWKVFVENFIESYHHRAVHSDTLQPFFPGEQSFLRNDPGTRWIALDHVGVDDAIEPFLVVAVFPLLLFAVQRPDSLAWARLEPIDRTTSSLAFSALAAPGTLDDDTIDFHLETLKAINEQDHGINDGVQRGLGSRHAVRPVLHPLEQGVDDFHRWYRDRVPGPI